MRVPILVHHRAEAARRERPPRPVPLARTLRTWPGWLPASAWLLALAVLAAAGCSPEEDEWSGPFGPGYGGPAVALPATGYPLTNADGVKLGRLEADATYFAVAPLPGTLLALQNPSGELVLLVTEIFGRPDTPCRYTAALLARDEGYTILASGDRVNDNGLEFHQVDLAKGATYLGLYCTTLRGNAGIQIGGESRNGNRLRNRQVHFVLNSVRP
jgi:hypothetical protein